MAALSVTLKTRSVFGNKRVHIGTATCAGTSGEIDTGLRSCEFIVLTPRHTGAIADAPVVTSTLPCTGSAVPVAFTSGLTAIEFMAIGY